MKNEEYNEKYSEKKLSGFTLIELIVVIAIIGILAAIIVPTMVGWMEKANNTADAENARIMCEAIQAEAMYVENYEVFTKNPWRWESDGQAPDDHGYIYVDKNEVRVSSWRLALLLQEHGFINDANATSNRKQIYNLDDGEVIGEFVYRSPNCSRMLCKSNKTWYRYQVNICFRDGTIKFTYSAASKDGEYYNKSKQSSKANKQDAEASKKFAEKAGLGEADEETSLGDPSS